MKLIKTRLRSSLQEPHLDDLLMLALELPLSSDFRIPDNILNEIIEAYITARQVPDRAPDGRHREAKFASFDLYQQVVKRIITARTS